MKMMRPLEQFVCDTCGQLIQKPEEGWLEWIHDPNEDKSHSFRICHHSSYSPRGDSDGCYSYSREKGRNDMHLHHALEDRTATLLYFVDLGKHHEPDFTGPHVRDLREWAELVRRLAIPYYEQARFYWNRAEEHGYFQGANEILVYTEGFLKGLIEQYGDGADS